MLLGNKDAHIKLARRTSTNAAECVLKANPRRPEMFYGAKAESQSRTATMSAMKGEQEGDYIESYGAGPCTCFIFRQAFNCQTRSLRGKRRHHGLVDVNVLMRDEY